MEAVLVLTTPCFESQLRCDRRRVSTRLRSNSCCSTHEVRIAPGVVDVARRLGVRLANGGEELVALLDGLGLDDTLLDEVRVKVRVGPRGVDVVATICERR